VQYDRDYYGQMQDGKKVGRGSQMISMVNGIVWLREGYWSNGAFAGQSRYVTSEGNHFTGVGDMADHWEGEYHWFGGSSYVGSIS
jgi:hypothetical protein